MKNTDWERLQNGSDIRGTALEEAGSEIDLTETVIKNLGKSFVTWLSRQINIAPENLKIAIGFDSRITAEKINNYLKTSITNRGADVYECGMASTPAMFMSTILESHQYDGAIMITASHMPFDKNGLKFFTDQGGLEEEDISSLIKIIKKEDYIKTADRKGNITKVNLIKDYAQHIRSIIKNGVNEITEAEKPLSDFNIIVDAGNGGGGFFVNQILEPLGADTTGSQFLKPDGRFPNHIPDPENNQAMESIKEAVIQNNADLGIIFDTDVDRAAVVDKTGQAINRNKLIALAATIVLEENPGSYIVTDSVTSKGLKSFIEEKLGGYHHRFKRGYKNVINEAKRLESENKSAPLAIETSGHAAFRENYFLDDGAYLVAKILIKMARMDAKNQGELGSLIKDLEEANIKNEYRMTINPDDFINYGRQVLENLKAYVEESDEWELAPKNFEGVRVNCGDSAWFLMRLSLHDPVLVLNIECNKEETLENIKKQLSKFLGNFEELNIEPLL